jgi:site-specific DNA-methyltransferase (adenine-specific)
MLEKNKIYLGDCLDIMKDIDDESVDLILCDPPYGVHSMDWDKILPFDKLWEHYERIIKPKGNILIFANNMFAHKLALSNEKLYRYDLVWKKSKCGSSLTAKYMPLKKHENIIVFGKSAAKYNPQMVEGEPYQRKRTQIRTNNLKYGVSSVEVDNKGTRHPITILDFPQKWRRQDQLHPTQKPLELCEWLIKTYSDENDLVLDNCMGSGSTIIGAINCKRDYIGIEIEEKYFKITEKRINNEL